MSVPYNFAASVMYPDAKVRKPKGYEPAYGRVSSGAVWRGC